MSTRFKTPMLKAMYETCLTLAADNFSEFYYGDGRTNLGPRFPRRGAGHRHAFWNGFNGATRPDGSPTAVPGSLSYAAFRAGEAFRKQRGGGPVRARGITAHEVIQ